MIFCDMKMLCVLINGVFNRKVSFTIHLSLVENLHFQFILILGRVRNWQKSCDRSIFSLHVWNIHMKWKNRPATAFLRINDSAWIAYKMEIQRKKSYKWNLTSYLWVKWNTSFEKRIQRGYCNDFLR